MMRDLPYLVGVVDDCSSGTRNKAVSSLLATDIPSIYRTAIIAHNDAMILPYDANPSRTEFSDRK